MIALRGRLRSLFPARRPTGPSPVLIGHSHSRAVFEAADASGFALRGYNFWTAPQPAIAEDRSRFHPDIAETLATGAVFSMVGGAAHAVLGMVRHPRAFDFVLPDRPDLPLAADAEIIPFAAMRAAMAHAVAEYLEIIALVRTAASGRVYHVEAPPPLEDDDRVLADVPWTFFADLTREVAPAALRYKCWRLHASLVAAFCADLGVGLVPVPAPAISDTGYLHPEFYEDAMHVNAAYGALVLAQIRERS